MKTETITKKRQLKQQATLGDKIVKYCLLYQLIIKLPHCITLKYVFYFG